MKSVSGPADPCGPRVETYGFGAWIGLGVTLGAVCKAAGFWFVAGTKVAGVRAPANDNLEAGGQVLYRVD